MPKRPHLCAHSARCAGCPLLHLGPRRYKYLAHVDGQGLSSRLDQLLPLGSLIFKEESGYTTYYHHLLR